MNQPQPPLLLFTPHLTDSTKPIPTQHLHYQPYIPIPQKKLPQIPKQIKQNSPPTITTILHPIPPLQISHIPLLIPVSSPHTKPPYPPNQYPIHRINQILP
ncbi:molybdenum cofactor biosynthesis protein MoaE, partial [Staphylococcus epidermidis]|uniref:molybdenum cofactor biosynthesis protein MoaE n=1 Tax=Staphylococcus epidermidis TaxID=1282 RepID=UPI0037DA4251